jgi:hypothetical protein
MSNKLRIPSPWSQLAVFLGLWGACLIFSFILITVVYHLAGVSTQAGLGVTDPGTIDVGKLAQGLFSLSMFGLTGFLFGRLAYRERPGYELGLRAPSKAGFYLLAIVLLIAAIPLEEWLGELNKQIPLWQWMIKAEQDNERLVESFLKINHPFDPVINLLIMAAIPAFCEELCFRGALQPILIRICKRPWAGILVTAFLFSFFHFEFEGFIPRMFLGVLLGAAYWYSGSLWVSILAHFFFNGVQIVVAMYSPATVSKTASMPVLFILISIVIVVGLLLRMRKLSPVATPANEKSTAIE